MFARLPHLHKWKSKAPQPVWCRNVCTGSAGRASTLPQRQPWSTGLVFTAQKERMNFGTLRYFVVLVHNFTTGVFFLWPVNKAQKGTKISKSAVISVSRKYLLHPVAAPEPFNSHSWASLPANPPGENVLSVLFKRLAVVQDDVQESSGCVCDPRRNSFSLGPLEASPLSFF